MSKGGTSDSTTSHQKFVNGVLWLKSRFEQIDSIWERKRDELIKLFDSNSKWLEDTRARLKAEEEERTRLAKLETGEKERLLKTVGKKKTKKEKIVEAPKIIPILDVKTTDAVSVITEPSTVKKRGRRKKSSILVPAQSNAESTVPSPATSVMVKKPRGRPPKKGRPSDSFKVQPTETALTPKTPKTVNLLEEEEIQSGKFSVKKTASIVLPSVKRPIRAAVFESVKKSSRLANVVQIEEQVEEPHQVEEVIKHTIANDDEPFVEKQEPQATQQAPAQRPLEWVTVTQQEAATAASFLPSPAVFNHKQAVLPSPAEAIPKVDSWTSQFLLKPKQLQFDNALPTVSALKTPASKTQPPPQSSTKKRKSLHLVDAPLPILKPAVPAFTNPPEPPVIINNTLPEESPLTKAKRLDSEYAQREQKLKAFLASGSIDLKKKLDNLRSNPPVKTTVAVTVEAVVEKPTDILKNLEQQEKPRVSVESVSEAESDTFVPLKPPPPEPQALESALPRPKQEAEVNNILHETPPDSITKMSMDEPDTTRTDSLDSAKSNHVDHFDMVPKQQKQGDPRAAVEEQRRRLQERQNKAIERRKQLHEKAQAAKLPKVHECMLTYIGTLFYCQTAVPSTVNKDFGPSQTVTRATAQTATSSTSHSRSSKVVQAALTKDPLPHGPHHPTQCTKQARKHPRLAPRDPLRVHIYLVSNPIIFVERIRVR